MTNPGRVVAIHLNTGSRAPLTPVERVRGIEGGGLHGDRHGDVNGRRPVLFMQQEVLDEFGLAPGDVREQVTVRGVPLPDLALGTQVRIGSTRLEVLGRCAPCERMDELQTGLRTALDGRRGVFMRIVGAGEIAVGDEVIVDPVA